MTNVTGIINLKYIGSVETIIVGFGSFEPNQEISVNQDIANFLLNTKLFEVVQEDEQTGDKDKLSKTK